MSQNKRQKVLDVSYLTENPDMTIACDRWHFEVDANKISNSFEEVETKSEGNGESVRLCLILAHHPFEHWGSLLNTSSLSDMVQCYPTLIKWKAKRSFAIQFIALIISQIMKSGSNCEKLLAVGDTFKNMPKMSAALDSKCPYQLLCFMLIIVYESTYDSLMGRLLGLPNPNSAADVATADSITTIYETLKKANESPPEISVICRQIYGTLPGIFSTGGHFNTVPLVLKLVRTAGYALRAVEKFHNGEITKLDPKRKEEKKTDDSDNDDDAAEVDETPTDVVNCLITDKLRPSNDLLNNMLGLRSCIIGNEKKMKAALCSVGELFTAHFVNPELSLPTY